MRNKITAGIIATALVASCGSNDPIQEGPRFALGGDSTAQTVQVTNSPVSLSGTTGGDWFQHLGNAQNIQGNAQFSGAPNLIAAVDLGANARRTVLSAAAPIIVGNSVYYYDNISNLHAVSTGGARQWSTSLKPVGEGSGDGFGGGLAYGNGTIYASTGFGEVVALNASNGAIKWRYVQNMPLRKPPMLAGNRVVVMSGGSTAVALDASTGAVAWRNFGAQTNLPSRLNAGVPASIGTRGVMPFSSGGVTMVELGAGGELWSQSSITDSFGGSKSVLSDITGDPVVVGNQIVIGTPSGIISLNVRTGASNWASDIGTKGPLIVSGNAVIGITPSQQLFRLSLGNGQLAFSKPLPRKADPDSAFSSKITHTDLRLADSAVWIADDDNKIRKYSAANGGLVAVYDLPISFAAAPVFGRGLMVGIGTNGQMLFYR